MDLQARSSNRYPVEVSGWDASESFFVEKAMLDWAGDETKEVRLRRTLREGCIIFLRMLHPADGASRFPIPCRAVKVASRGQHAGSVIRLVQLHPRPAFTGTVSSSNPSADRVA